MAYPAVAQRFEKGALFLHGWHYRIEDGRVCVLDLASGAFVEAEGAGGSALLDTLQ